MTTSGTDAALEAHTSASITDAALAELRARIGCEFEGPRPYVREATADAIRHFAHGIGDSNPLWCDDDYGRASVWSASLAPPTFLYACDRIVSGYVGGLPGVHAMFAGTDFRWRLAIRRGDTRWGERVAAVVALRPGAQPDAVELMEHCRQTLAGYKVPRHVVVVGEIRRTAVGKPDYRWAKAQAESAMAPTS